MDISFDNQLALSLLTTSNRLAVINMNQAMRTHPDIGLVTARQQGCSRLVATCMFVTVYNILSLTRPGRRYKQSARLWQLPLLLTHGFMPVQKTTQILDSPQGDKGEQSSPFYPTIICKPFERQLDKHEKRTMGVFTSWPSTLSLSQFVD